MRNEKLKQIRCAMHDTETLEEVKRKRRGSYSNSTKNLKSSERIVRFVKLIR